MTDATPKPLTHAQRRAVLDAFARALNREVHNLTQRPHLLWQQLYNRLQWEDEPVPGMLDPELERRSAPRAAPWLRTRTPFRESEAFRLVLAGHTGWVYGCAVSPDGSFIVSASVDNTLKVWDATTGTPLITIPLLGNLPCVALHPSAPFVACGDSGGNVYFLDLVGIEYGPIIVTASDGSDGPSVRCPACLEYLPLEEDWLGQVIDCSRSGCDGHMRVNPFVVGQARR